MKSVCPRCKEAILSLLDEETIICAKYETAFEVEDSSDEDKKE